MSIEIVTGDIFESKEKYLVHQTNCVSKRAAHLAKDVFDKYPYADIYTSRVEIDKPGHIIIRGDGLDKRLVVAILGQYYPGKPKYPDSTLDGIKAREKYFYHGLLRLAKIDNLESIAFPFGIGCGAAGGDWSHYLQMIVNFSKYVEEKQQAKVLIYKLENED